MKLKYSNSKLTVFWDSSKCIKAGRCDGQLPQVFDPDSRPWVKINAADPESIKRVIDSCPSGALSYQVPGEKKAKTIIKIMKDGPYKVSGECRLMKENGDILETDDVFALCRCGGSKKMPICDGTHAVIGFRDK
jgi:uncharacterized Fe-S cluster protein YjdI